MSGNFKQTKLALTVALVASLTAGAAMAKPLGFGGGAKAPAAPVTHERTPELDLAQVKCDQLQGKLDQAKKQLEAAKANLKAAEAELKAAKADREALGLRNQATQLASKAAIDPSISTISTAPAARVESASADAPTVHQIDGMNTTPLPAGGNVPTLQDLAPSNVP